MQKIEVIYEDEEIIVCRKPAGLPVQTASMTQQDMVSLLRNYFAAKRESAEVFVVHRLDQPVEGVMVFARTKQAAAALSRQIQQKGVDKYYLAVVEGVPKPDRGTVTDYLLRDGKTNTSKVVPKGTAEARLAVLHYQVQETYGNSSLVSIQLETGRHHQIRVQMAHMGHPLTGDKKYNPDCGSGYLPIALCSVKLSFLHPSTGKKMEFEVMPEGKAFKERQL